jgi:hypothetical protein
MSSPSEGPDGPAKVDKARLHGTATVRSATKEMRGLREQHLAVDREHVPDVTASPKASVEQYINAFAPIVGCTARMRRCRPAGARAVDVPAPEEVRRDDHPEEFGGDPLGPDERDRSTGPRWRTGGGDAVG